MGETSRRTPDQKQCQSWRGLFRILFSRTVMAVLLLLLNGFLLFSLLFELFEGITLIFGGLGLATAVMLMLKSRLKRTIRSSLNNI